MENKEETKPECFGCRSYFIYYSGKENKYVLTSNSLEAFDNGPCIDLREEPDQIFELMNLLQYYKKLLDNNKANLSIIYPENYSPSPEGLARLAREINETAKINQNLQKSLKTP